MRAEAPRRTACRAAISGTATGTSRRCWPITPSTAATAAGRSVGHGHPVRSAPARPARCWSCPWRQAAADPAGREQRRFLEDGDAIILRGAWSAREARIGFGEASGRVLNAAALHLLSQFGGLSGAHRAQSQGPALPDDTAASAARRRRAAQPPLSSSAIRLACCRLWMIPLTLTQSLAIIEYLEDTQPMPALLPRDAAARAWIARWRWIRLRHPSTQ